MPLGFYILTCHCGGLFCCHSWKFIVAFLRARYRQASSESREHIEGVWPVAVANFTLIIGALFDFVTWRLWWWFAPALSILAFWVGLVVYTRGGVIAVTPFIYTLF
jgi:hypothetical protein